VAITRKIDQQVPARKAQLPVLRFVRRNARNPGKLVIERIGANPTGRGHDRLHGIRSDVPVELAVGKQVANHRQHGGGLVGEERGPVAREPILQVEIAGFGHPPHEATEEMAGLLSADEPQDHHGVQAQAPVAFADILLPGPIERILQRRHHRVSPARAGIDHGPGHAVAVRAHERKQAGRIEAGELFVRIGRQGKSGRHGAGKQPACVRKRRWKRSIDRMVTDVHAAIIGPRRLMG